MVKQRIDNFRKVVMFLKKFGLFRNTVNVISLIVIGLLLNLITDEAVAYAVLLCLFLFLCAKLFSARLDM